MGIFHLAGLTFPFAVVAVVLLAAGRRGHVLGAAGVAAAAYDLAGHRRGGRREEQLKGREGIGQSLRVTGRRGRRLIHT